MAWTPTARTKRYLQYLDASLTALGLSCVSIKNERYVVSKRKLFIPLIISALLFYLVAYQLVHSQFQSNNIGGTLVARYLDITGAVMAALCIIFATVNSNQYAKMKQGFFNFDNAISFDINLITRNSSKYFIFYLTVYAISFVADFILYQYDDYPYAGIKLLSTYIFQIYNIICIFQFSLCLFWLRKSFAFINVDVVFHSITPQKNKTFFEFLPRNVVNPINTEVIFFPFEKSEAPYDQKIVPLEKIRFLRCLYHELYRLTREVNEVFSTRLILGVGHNFVLGTIFIYGGINELVKYLGNQNNSMSLIEVFINFKWSFISFFSIYGFIWPATTTCNETVETRIIVQELLTKSLNDDLRKELHSFALQFNHEIVQFSPHGFFRLNNNLLLSIIGAVVSYLVILIQFRISMV